MKELSERQKLILGLIVQDYVEAAQPVGSKRLVDYYGLDVSSATVRNEMAELTESGFLRQPFTSAGRVPTEEGFRFFVGELMHRQELPASIKHTISHQFYQARHEVQQWMRLAASVLASQSRAAALITLPQSQQVRFKHLELILTSGRQVLMIMVLESGQVLQQMLALKESFSQERLSSIADQLNGLLRGQAVEEMTPPPEELGTLAAEVFRLVGTELLRLTNGHAGEVYHDGWTNVLSEPEFSEGDAAQRALRVLEERPLLENLLTEVMSESQIGGVQVLIGGEGRWEQLHDFSLVLARYGAPGTASGYLGVLGPIRMAYGRAVSTVDYVAGLLSEVVSGSMTSGSMSSGSMTSTKSKE
ncbi:MAG: heat-inducible transcription repressor HrcA [Anaerolineales bacterium]|nr:heat-inducible transcription repressor HrcA [Anaerolineales bacterium]MCW5855800.1 heat-inducible transcription repressor HrcA [Anaerolineales bacterium]